MAIHLDEDAREHFERKFSTEHLTLCCSHKRLLLWVCYTHLNWFLWH